METLLLDEFKSNAIFRLKEGQRMILLAFNNIDEQQLWLYPQKNGLALGNQIVHSCGNMRQYIISSLGGQSDVRKRDLEFSIQGGMSKKEVLEHLEKTLHQAVEVIQKTEAKEYIKIRKVQGFTLSGVGVVLHAVEHFSYHVGQIAFWVKQHTNQDLGFYKNVDLNQSNS